MDALVPNPQKLHYGGKVVILADADTEGVGEFAALALSSVPGAVVVGSQTAGSAGRVSTVPLPGGLYTWINSVGVFTLDGHPIERRGIVPDVVVEPTISDIQRGYDPALAEAVHLIVDSNSH